MKRDKKFYINAIKMDLYRVVTAVGNIQREIPKESVKEFLKHADEDFEKIPLTKREKKLRKKLTELAKRLDSLEDPHDRLRWTEEVLTTRCRL
jgi:DNA-binding transcriptional MerR regulator